MQLSKLNLALTRIGKASFSPKSLFSSGAQGAWYDPSDFSTMFEDAAGTIPITSPLEKPVGLMLDKSKGLTLGSELVTNGDFNNGTTGWTNSSATIAVVSGEIQVSAQSGSPSSTIQTLSCFVAGRFYRVTATYRQEGNGGLAARVSLFGVNSPNNASSTPLTASIIVAATGTTASLALQSYGTSSTISYFDNISVRELPGNHATQSTTTSRPTLSARYNLLTKTERFDDAAWTKAHVSVTQNTTTAPDGTMTANALLETTSTATHFINSSAVGNSLQNQTFSCYIKPNGRNYCVLYLIQTGGAGYVYAYFDLTGIGSVNSYGKSGVAPNIPTVSIEPAKNGFFKCSITGIAGTSNTTCYVQINAINTISPIPAGDSYTGDTSKGIYIWGADLRVSNDGIGLPAYQRVNTSTDYDYAGFPAYVRFDGVDDGMVTNSIDFSATDKMFVAAGVRKLSDAAAGAIVETGDTNVTTGVFSCATSGTNGTDRQSWACSFSGSSLLVVRQPRTYVSPITNVLSYQMNSAASTNATQIIPRVNGLTPSIIYDAAGPAASGSFANKALYIGIRAGSIFPLNGRLYSLIVIGKAASAAEIASTEAYINNKTKAY